MSVKKIIFESFKFICQVTAAIVIGFYFGIGFWLAYLLIGR